MTLSAPWRTAWAITSTSPTTSTCLCRHSSRSGMSSRYYLVTWKTCICANAIIYLIKNKLRILDYHFCFISRTMTRTCSRCWSASPPWPRRCRRASSPTASQSTSDVSAFGSRPSTRSETHHNTFYGRNICI